MRTMLFLVALALAPECAAGDGCTLFAEVSVESVKQGSLQACVRTGNPVACVIAAAAQDVATAALARKGVTAGCEWAVEKVDNLPSAFRVQADAKEAPPRTRKAQDALEKSKDVRFKARAP